MWQSMPSKRAVIALMNGIATASGQCRATACMAERPLHGDQRAMVRADQPHACGQPRRDMRVVGILHGGIDHQEQHAVLGRIGRARHHQVVEDAACLVGAAGYSAGGPAPGSTMSPGTSVSSARATVS